MSKGTRGNIGEKLTRCLKFSEHFIKLHLLWVGILLLEISQSGDPRGLDDHDFCNSAIVSNPKVFHVMPNKCLLCVHFYDNVYTRDIFFVDSVRFPYETHVIAFHLILAQ